MLTVTVGGREKKRKKRELVEFASRSNVFENKNVPTIDGRTRRNGKRQRVHSGKRLNRAANSML